MLSSGLGSTNRIKSIFYSASKTLGHPACASLSPSPSASSHSHSLTLQSGDIKQGLQLVPCVWNALPSLSCLANACFATVSVEGFPSPA